jgi:Leucine Rich repeat
MGRFGAARPRARGKVSDVMVRDMVAALPKLVELQLSTAVQLTDAGVAAVAEHCPQIRTLKIAGNHAITDRAVGALRSCRSLEMLDLSFCSLLTDAAAKDLAALPALTTLSVARWNVTDAFVQDLLCGGGGGGGKALKDLNLAGCAAISDGALDHISVHAAERMEALHLRQCRRVSDAGLELLVRSCTALRELDISCNDNITADAVGLLGEMGSLRVLKASQMSNVSDAAVARLAAAGQLTSVRLSWCPLLTDAAADSLAGCRSLTEVNLSGVKLLTDAGVYALASLPALKRVKLTYCGRLSNAAVDALAGAANAPLKEVDVRSCRRIHAEKLEELRACCETLHDSTRVSQPARKIWSCRRSLPRLPNPA